MKECIKCNQEKDIESFYRSSRNLDGRTNICKICWNKIGKIRRQSKAVDIAKYNKLWASSDRGKLIKAKSQSKYSKSEKGKNSRLESINRYPNARRSRGYYYRNKHKLTVLDYCERCDRTGNIAAHHCDYNSPLDVIYLCSQCHADEHAKNTPLNRTTGIFTENKK